MEDLLRDKAGFATALLKRFLSDPRIKDLLRIAASESAEKPVSDWELYELTHILGSRWMYVSWTRLSSGRVALHLEEAKSRNPTTTTTFRSALKALNR